MQSASSVATRWACRVEDSWAFSLFFLYFWLSDLSESPLGGLTVGDESLSQLLNSLLTQTPHHR